MSRNFKLGFVIAVFLIGFILIYLDKVTLMEFGSFLGGFAAIGLSIEKWIEPQKEEKLKQEIKKEL